MPFIHTQTNARISAGQEAAIKEKLGKAIALFPGKSEYWLMLRFTDNARMWFRGYQNVPIAMVEVELFGQAEAGLSILDDMPDYFPFLITSNEACDGSVGTSILQDWAYDKPLFAMPQPMQFDDPLVQKHCRREIEECWKFIEEQTGLPMNWDLFVEYIEKYNQLTLFEREKWDVAANTPYYPINSVAQALYRIYYSQDGYRDIWAQTDRKVKKIMYRCVEKKIETFPETRHRVLAWSCAP